MPRRRVVEFSPRAGREIEEARRWWREHREKAPDAFDEDFAELITRLEVEAELLGQPARNVPHVRRALLKRVRYYVYFRIRESNGKVQVAAFWHASRGREPSV